MQQIGAIHLSDGRYLFRVWAYNVQHVDLHLLRQNIYVPMQRDERGYHTCIIDDIDVGDTYLYRLDGEKERPDPASRWQPEGVHGHSAIIAPDFAWTDRGFRNPTLRNSVMYELHVGTFTPEGTFEAIIPHLPYLKALGVTTLQLMPIAEFPGERNWGYDGVQLYAPHHAYGGADGLRQLVNAAHNKGIAVMLDVVYNHLGPEGNYLWDYAPYFSQRYKSDWGDALNFDGAQSDEVHNFFIQNALYWLRDYHIDGLRLDATHALYDQRAVPILEALSIAVHDYAERANRRIHLIAENDSSNRRLVLPRAANGVGLDGQWLDDFHHAIHTLLTGENQSYYADYGKFEQLIKCLREGFIYSGQYSVAWGRSHGTSSADIRADKFIVATQTHDQVGNRMLGERLHHLTDFAGAKLAAGLLALSPYTPMLFMGEEYAEPAPFLYFTSHSDEHLVTGVRAGRKEEFKEFAWQGEPPDPQAESTFQQSKLDHTLRHTDGQHKIMQKLYATLLQIRRSYSALTNPNRQSIRIMDDTTQRCFWLIRQHDEHTIYAAFNFHRENNATMSVPCTSCRKIFDATDAQWQTDDETRNQAADSISQTTTITIAPKSFVVYVAS